MNIEEAITCLKGLGFNRFFHEKQDVVVIYAGCSEEGRAKQFKLEDGKLFEHSGYDFVSDIWDERELVIEKLGGVL